MWEARHRDIAADPHNLKEVDLSTAMPEVLASLQARLAQYAKTAASQLLHGGGLRAVCMHGKKDLQVVERPGAVQQDVDTVAPLSKAILIVTG